MESNTKIAYNGNFTMMHVSYISKSVSIESNTKESI